MIPTPDLIMAEFWGPPMWPHGRAWIWTMLVLLLMCMWSGMVRTSPRLLTRPLGCRQRYLLRLMVDPNQFLIYGNRVADSLARRGLVKPHGRDGRSGYQITPAGLRHVADEMEAGTMTFDPPARRECHQTSRDGDGRVGHPGVKPGAMPTPST